MTQPSPHNSPNHSPRSTHPTSDCILKVSNLCKRFGDILAVDRLSLELQRGEILGFLGPNGAGKTTTLKMLSGLLRPDEGTVELNGEPLRLENFRGRRELGIAPQEIVVWGTLTCLEQLEFAACLYDLPQREARARALQLLEAFGLADKAKRLAKTLSGGMLRRLNIALGLVHGPEILFLDEPQAGLDPQSRVLVRDYLASLRGHTTILLTTHDMEEAEKLADRVCIVDRGKLLVLDTVAQLKNGPGAGRLFELELEEDAEKTLLPALSQLAPQGAFAAQGEVLSFPAASSPSLLAQVLGEVSRLGLSVRSVRTRESTLEDVFLSLTGRSLRE